MGLDSVVMYGKYESGTSAPTDLDACNGHTGPVPDDAEYSLTAGTVYHYHMTDAFPHTLGCYGPVASEVRATRSQSFIWIVCFYTFPSVSSMASPQLGQCILVV